MHPPGLRLRRLRERLGLTYRDVERASFQIALKRGRPDFILHISRLADMENNNVVPSLFKLYSLAAIYHLDPVDLSAWYEAPFQQTINDGASFPPPRTHLAECLLPPPTPIHGEGIKNTDATALFGRLPSALENFPGIPCDCRKRLRYGYVGLSDRRMVPILRPGSVVIIDTSLRSIDDSTWSSEYDRPLYFVELREGYRCGWFHKNKSTLIMQPHTLSHCAPEAWQTPDEAELIGQVVGVSTYFNDSANYSAGVRTKRSYLSRKAL
jgi:transcriptional regulator with XRE-family HTH domain